MRMWSRERRRGRNEGTKEGGRKKEEWTDERIAILQVTHEKKNDDRQSVSWFASEGNAGMMVSTFYFYWKYWLLEQMLH